MLDCTGAWAHNGSSTYRATAIAKMEVRAANHGSLWGFDRYRIPMSPCRDTRNPVHVKAVLQFVCSALRIGQGGFFLMKKPLRCCALPLQQLENSYSRRAHSHRILSLEQAGTLRFFKSQARSFNVPSHAACAGERYCRTSCAEENGFRAHSARQRAIGWAAQWAEVVARAAHLRALRFLRRCGDSFRRLLLCLRRRPCRTRPWLLLCDPSPCKACLGASARPRSRGRAFRLRSTRAPRPACGRPLCTQYPNRDGRAAAMDRSSPPFPDGAWPHRPGSSGYLYRRGTPSIEHVSDRWQAQPGTPAPLRDTFSGPTACNRFRSARWALWDWLALRRGRAPGLRRCPSSRPALRLQSCRLRLSPD